MIPDKVYAAAKKAVPQCFAMLLGDRDAKTAVKYLLPDFAVRVTRQNKQSGRDGRCRSSTYLVTVGKPNYLGRLFVKDALAAGVPFPVRKVQLHRYPKKRA